MICKECHQDMKVYDKAFIDVNTTRYYYKCPYGHLYTKTGKPEKVNPLEQYFVKPDLWWEEPLDEVKKPIVEITEIPWWGE